MTTAFFEFILKIMELIPVAKPLAIPEGIEDGFVSMFGLLGFFFPYSIYAPLIIFILGFTVFRIAWSVFITFKR